MLDYGQVPLLEIDGLRLVQSNSILRYVARRTGRYPKDPREAYVVDSVCDSVNDARGPLLSYPFHLDVERTKTEMESKVERYFLRWECLLKKTDSPFFLANGWTLADVVLYELVDFLTCVAGQEYTEKILEHCPSVMKMAIAMSAVGDVKKYSVTRKKEQLSWKEYAEKVRRTLDGLRGK